MARPNKGRQRQIGTHKQRKVKHIGSVLQENKGRQRHIDTKEQRKTKALIGTG